jgi:hypothetical protein
MVKATKCSSPLPVGECRNCQSAEPWNTNPGQAAGRGPGVSDGLGGAALPAALEVLAGHAAAGAELLRLVPGPACPARWRRGSAVGAAVQACGRACTGPGRGRPPSPAPPGHSRARLWSRRRDYVTPGARVPVVTPALLWLSASPPDAFTVHARAAAGRARPWSGCSAPGPRPPAPPAGPGTRRTRCAAWRPRCGSGKGCPGRRWGGGSAREGS